MTIKEIMTIKEKIKQARKEKGLSQKKLAKVLGYSSGQFVSNWERGLSAPPVDRLAKMALIFNFDEEELLAQFLEELVESKKKAFKKAMDFHKSRADSAS